MPDHSVQPAVKMTIGRVIQDALNKADYHKDKVFADSLVSIFRDAAAKAEAIGRNIPAPKPSQPHWL